MTDFRDLLPIGSVVAIKGNNIDLLMIVGYYKQIEFENDSISEYDYCGVPYPYGLDGEETQFYFNHRDITEISYIGFINERFKEYVEAMKRQY